MLQSLLSWPAWINGVVLAVAINLVSAYMKPALDARLERVSGRWREQQLAARSESLRQVELLTGDTRALMMISLQELRFRIRALAYGLIGAMAFAGASLAAPAYSEQLGLSTVASGVVSVTGMAIGAVAMLVGVRHHRSAVELSRLINASLPPELRVVNRSTIGGYWPNSGSHAVERGSP